MQISRWMILHGWVDQLKLIAIKFRHELGAINVIPCEIVDILKISKSIKLLVKMKYVSFIL